jgi:hypothetical protein
MQEKPVEQVSLFIRDQITGRHLFNREALLALGINPASERARVQDRLSFEDECGRPPRSLERLGSGATACRA